ncbi:MAG: ornithine carbamoyltransferase [Gracilibacteraceae bacterium]|nr:ornithine carbamoyltransferase [Gracilibacteraceae bacterium]
MIEQSKERFRGRDFVTLQDFTHQEIEEMADAAIGLKRQLAGGIPHPILQGKTIGLIFTKSSTRTRVSFEVGIYQLGGYGLFLSDRDIQIGRGEVVQDTARVLSRMVDGIMIRTSSHQDVLDLAHHSTIPVINGLTDYLHPTQVLADLMTIREHKGSWRGLKLAYIGDGNNVAHSLLNGATKMGMHITIASPDGYKPAPEIVAQAQANAAASGGSAVIVTEPAEAVAGADIVYTDVWASMGQETEAVKRQKVFAGYQVNAALMGRAHPNALVMHCLPAHRGEEITEDVIEGPQSVVFDQAENRLHAHKAIMALLIH